MPPHAVSSRSPRDAADWRGQLWEASTNLNRGGSTRRGNLPVEPDVLHPVAVVDAVDHRHEPLDVGLGAGAAARIEDDRPRPILGETALDLPHQLLALPDIGFGRLPIDQLVD